MASIPPESLNYQLAHINDDRAPALRALYILGIILATVSVALRVLSRTLSRVGLKADDWTIIISLFLFFGLSVLTLLGVFNFALGHHVVAVGADGVTHWLKLLYIYTVFYNFVILLIKNSILLLYHRIFIIPRFQLVVKFSLLFMILYQISTLLVDIMTCLPIRGYWDKSTPAVCVNQVTYFISSAGINVFTDVWILILPLPVIWNLKMSRKRKVSLCIIFLLGSVVCVATSMRIVTYLYIDYNDVTWTFVPGAHWTNAEVCLSFICACLPTMRPLLRRLRKGTYLASSSKTYVNPSNPYHAGKTSNGHQSPGLWPIGEESTRILTDPRSEKPYMGARSYAWHEQPLDGHSKGRAEDWRGINVKEDIELTAYDHV